MSNNWGALQIRLGAILFHMKTFKKINDEINGFH